jgi:hypothetical protein
LHQAIHDGIGTCKALPCNPQTHIHPLAPRDTFPPVELPIHPNPTFIPSRLDNIDGVNRGAPQKALKSASSRLIFDSAKKIPLARGGCEVIANR